MAPEMSIHRFSHITTFLWLFMDRVISDNFKNVVGCFHQIYFIISDVTCFYGSSQTNLLYCGNFIDKNHVVIFTRPFEIRRREGKRGPHGYWEITQMGPAPSPLWNWRDVFMENNTFLLSRSRCAQLDDWLQSTHGNLEFSTMCTLLTLPLCEVFVVSLFDASSRISFSLRLLRCTISRTTTILLAFAATAQKKKRKHEENVFSATTYKFLSRFMAWTWDHSRSDSDTDWNVFYSDKYGPIAPMSFASSDFLISFLISDFRMTCCFGEGNKNKLDCEECESG